MVQMSYPMTMLLDRRFWEALNSRTKAKRVVIPVRQCATGPTTEVPVRKPYQPTGFISYRTDGGKRKRTSSPS